MHKPSLIVYAPPASPDHGCVECTDQLQPTPLGTYVGRHRANMDDPAVSDARYHVPAGKVRGSTSDSRGRYAAGYTFWLPEAEHGYLPHHAAGPGSGR